jgi:hypothetical protein
MKNIALSIFLAFVSLPLLSQKIDKLIREKSVKKVIATLAHDDMKGRSSLEPANIGKAAAFIEKHFKKTGLEPLPGLTGFKQEFTKEQIIPAPSEVAINGKNVDPAKVIIMHERQSVNLISGLTIKTIGARPDAEDKTKALFGMLGPVMGDTTSSLIMVDPTFEDGFNQLKGYFGQRIVSKQPGVKVFVLSSETVTSYQVVDTRQRIETITMANVVGMIKGKTRPDEYVIFSAHYDHIGISAPVEGDSIANGADDDASGTAAILTLARFFKKLNNNERSLIFVAFTAEEIGGYGSQHFSRQLDPAKVMAMFNIEMIGKPSKWGTGSAFITGFDRSDFGSILQKNLEGTEFTFYADPYPEENLFYRSDNATLARQGVPAHSISTDQIPTDKFYHTVDDEVTTLDMKNIVATIKAIALSAKTMISGADTPTRIK